MATDSCSGMGFALGQVPGDGITRVVWGPSGAGGGGTGQPGHSSDNSGNGGGGGVSGHRLLLASSWDSTLRLYDPMSAVLSRNPDTALRAMYSSEAAVLDCAFMGSTRGVSGSLDCKVTTYDFQSSAKQVIGEHDKAVRCVCVVGGGAEGGDGINSGGNVVISGGWDKRVRVWDVRSRSGGGGGGSSRRGNPVRPVGEIELEGKVFTMGLCGGVEEWERLLIGTSGRKIYVYDRRDLSTPVQVTRRCALLLLLFF